ncbi:MAG: TonB-dependent receptor [Acidobacteria bacterium]|nr:TonB-dependent receptor [Acidobacteriota bacterium]
MSWSQGTTAAITGTVKDSTGAVMPGVSVTVRNVETGVARTVQSGTAGRYSVPNIAPGQYEVQAEISGFQSEVRRGIDMTMGREAVVDFTLQVGQVAEQVVVTGEAPLVDTSSAAVAGLVDQQQVQELPLNGRSLTQLATLQPGVLFYRSSSACTGLGENLSINGARQRQNNFLLNGTSVLNFHGKSPGGVSGHQLGAEGVREFTVLSNSYSAEFGKSAGGVINAITKSGTNTFHGSVFEYLRNDNLEAPRWEDNAFAGGKNPEFRRNQFGGSLGGPIRRDQTFFFLSSEYLRDREGNTSTPALPNAEARQGRVPGVDPFTINPAIQPFLALLPVPQGADQQDGTSLHTVTNTQPTNQNYGNVRVDHQLSDTDSLYGSYIIDFSDRRSGGGLGFTWEDNIYRSQYATLEETKIISPTLLNTAHFGLNRSVTAQLPDCTDEVRKLTTYTPTGICGRGGPPQFGVGFGPRNFIMTSFQYWDTVSWNPGMHSFKFGGLWERFRVNGSSIISPGGNYSFLGGTANMLQANVSFFEGPLPEALHAWRGYRQNLFAFFANDAVRLRSNLTVNLGLRYEFVTVPTEVDGLMARLETLTSAAHVGDPAFENPSLKNFSPRIGIAWSPGASQNTSIRAGFGLFFDQFTHALWNTSLFQTPPLWREARISRNPAQGIIVPFPNAFDVYFVPGHPRVLPSFVFAQDGKPSQPYTLQYNLTVQRQLPGQLVVQGSYVGSGGRHLSRGVDNQALPTILSDGRIFFPANSVRRNPNFEEIRYKLFDANSSYNSLQMAIRRRFARGVGFQVSYTLAKAIDTASDSQGAGDLINDAPFATLPEFPEIDRGRSAFDVRHNLSLNVSADIPFGSHVGIPGKLLGGWKIQSIFSRQSGLPFTTTISGTVDASVMRTRSTRGQLRPSLKPGYTVESVTLSVPSASNPLGQYLDPAAFILPDPGFLGTLGRNVFSGPSLFTIDFSLTKETAITEQMNLEFRSEFFNMMNHPNFSLPARNAFNRSVNVPQGGFGRITDTTGPGRQIQLALKLTF